MRNREIDWKGVLLAALAVGIVSRIGRARSRNRDRAFRSEIDLQQEPVLGYDGMSSEVLLDWLDEAELDREVIGDMIRYEEQHAHREPIIEALNERLG